MRSPKNPPAHPGAQLSRRLSIQQNAAACRAHTGTKQRFWTNYKTKLLTVEQEELIATPDSPCVGAVLARRPGVGICLFLLCFRCEANRLFSSNAPMYSLPERPFALSFRRGSVSSSSHRRAQLMINVVSQGNPSLVRGPTRTTTRPTI